MSTGRETNTLKKKRENTTILSKTWDYLVWWWTFSESFYYRIFAIANPFPHKWTSTNETLTGFFLFCNVSNETNKKKTQQNKILNNKIKIKCSTAGLDSHIFFLLKTRKYTYSLKQQQNLPDYTMKHYYYYFFWNNNISYTIFFKPKFQTDTSCSPGTKQKTKKLRQISELILFLSLVYFWRQWNRYCHFLRFFFLSADANPVFDWLVSSSTLTVQTPFSPVLFPETHGTNKWLINIKTLRVRWRSYVTAAVSFVDYPTRPPDDLSTNFQPPEAARDDPVVLTTGGEAENSRCAQSLYLFPRDSFVAPRFP